MVIEECYILTFRRGPGQRGKRRAGKAVFGGRYDGVISWESAIITHKTSRARSNASSFNTHTYLMVGPSLLAHQLV